MIISAFKKALDDAIKIVDDISIPVDVKNQEEMLKLIKSALGTKFVARWSDLMCKLALDAVRTVATEEGDRREVDIKRYARVEKVCLCHLLLCAQERFCKLYHLSPSLIPRSPAAKSKSPASWMALC